MIKTRFIFVQLGSPASPKVRDVRAFLKSFLGDPRVVDLNPFLWKIILYLFILPFRPRRSAELYRNIWDGESFPLITNSQKFIEKLRHFLKKESESFDCSLLFVLTKPRWSEFLEEWKKENYRQENWIVVPLFPQYSESTSASIFDGFSEAIKNSCVIPNHRWIFNFHRSRAFIDNSLSQIKTTLSAKNADALLLSFHGLPLRRVVEKKDPYAEQCLETFELIKLGLKMNFNKGIHYSFQSRFGSEEWIAPSTDDQLKSLIDSGAKTIAVYCPSFVADCLESLDEIGRELAHLAKSLGAEIIYIPCLNDDDKWCQSMAQWCVDKANNRNTDYEVQKVKGEFMHQESSKASAPLDKKTKKTLKIVFLTLFLDLVGFSIIFPLFPALAKHYLINDQNNYFLNLIFHGITGLLSFGSSSEGIDSAQSIVLFGGALGAIYSLLQFIASPLWGGISDRVGRKPILLISVFGLAMSYVLWFFSGSFTLLILARFIGGIMGGNISVASAVVADITDESQRSKGMAIIGIAFALGFIIGPAMGGIFSSINLLNYYPQWAQFGVNPFSVAALVASILSFFNLFYLYFSFSETLDPSKVLKHQRISNPIRLFRPLPYFEVNIVNFSYFIFLLAFSGMEFTLTFLASERFGFSSMQNAYMFVFIGLILVLVQGGYVRRKAHVVGEGKMAKRGMLLLIPGLLLIAWTKNIYYFYFGLSFLAIGSSLIIPCLTSLVSLYSPQNVQGQSLGIFRSLGALARVFGPIWASLFFWKIGPSGPYWIGPVLIFIALFILQKLPEKMLKK